jgi:hypothetical protein
LSTRIAKYQMRNWLNLFESSHVSSDFVVHYVADMNDREDPYEGEVPERIAEYDEYELCAFPIADLCLDGYQYDSSLAGEYAAMNVQTMPPIVVEPNGQIIDGFHRAQAAVQRGDDSIAAYAGICRI